MMKTSNSVLSAVIGSVLGLAAMLGAPHAYAGDQKVYSGSACGAVYPQDYANLIRYKEGIFAGPGQAVVSCPIVRDNDTNVNGTNGAIVRVYNTRSDAGGTACVLYVMGPHGELITTKTVQTKTLGKVDLDLDVNTSVNQGPYYLLCTLPVNSGVMSYSINEY